MVGDNKTASRVKRAELMSTIGAGVLGAGIALVFADYLVRYATVVLIAGLITHAGGMFDKHRLETGRPATRVGWFDVLYWVCWAMLAVLAGVVEIGRI